MFIKLGRIIIIFSLGRKAKLFYNKKKECSVIMLAPEKETIRLDNFFFSSNTSTVAGEREQEHFKESLRELVSCTIQF